jgi:predicted acyltransferase
MSTENINSDRLVSLDTLRGFDMFWIIGGHQILSALSAIVSASWLTWLLARLEHPRWDGFEPYDLIFPLFLFIAGVSTPMSIAKRQSLGATTGNIYRHIILRGVILVALGIIYNGLPTDWSDAGVWADVRYPSVLGRIGLAYMFAAIIAMNTQLTGRLITIVTLLVGYWAALRFIPVPEFGANDLLTPGHTLTDYIDRTLIRFGTLYHGDRDPEGLFATLPAIATALIGVITGQMLMRSDRSGMRKTITMLLGGLVCLGLGWAWSRESLVQFHLNKNLWSSSFVLYCAGWSLLLLAIFYLVIDVWKFRWWTKIFAVIGANAIFIYMAAKLIDFKSLSSNLFAGPVSLSGAYGPVLVACGVLLIEWGLLYLMYSKKIFLKV